MSEKLEEYVRLLSAAPDLLAACKALVKHGPPEMNGDWACIECKPHSDMLIDGFRCGYHAAIIAIKKATLKENE